MDEPTTESSEVGYPEERDVKPFLVHMEDLRKMIVACAICLLIGMCIALPFTRDILGVLKIPLAKAGMDPDQYLKVTQIAAGFSIGMRIVFWGGLLFSAPIMLIFVGRFVYPGLTQREKNTISRSLLASVALFIAGACMGYFMTVPVGLRMMARITHAVGTDYDFIELADYVSFVLKLLLAFGLAFELPVVVLVLGSLGIVNSTSLRDKRRHVIVGLLIGAMLLTPSDPWTMLMMAAPLIALFESCIWLMWFKERRSKPA